MVITEWHYDGIGVIFRMEWLVFIILAHSVTETSKITGDILNLYIGSFGYYITLLMVIFFFRALSLYLSFMLNSFCFQYFTNQYDVLAASWTWKIYMVVESLVWSSDVASPGKLFSVLLFCIFNFYFLVWC